MKKKDRIEQLESLTRGLRARVVNYNSLIDSNKYLIEATTAELRKAERELAELHRPKEPKPGSVITFSRTYVGSRTTYEYAALRVGDTWYITGATCPRNGFTWGALLQFISGKNFGANLLRHSDIVVVKTGKVIEVPR